MPLIARGLSSSTVPMGGRLDPPGCRAWRYRLDMPADRPAGQDGSTRPRVIVCVTATDDGRVTLSRMERLLDDGPNLRWKGVWPPDADDLLTRRAAAIEQRHHPAVVLEVSGTFVADDAGSLQLPDTNVPVGVLRTDFLPYRSPRWFAMVDTRGRVAWTHKGDGETSLLVLASHSTPLPYLGHLRQADPLSARRRLPGGPDLRTGKASDAARRHVPGIAGRRRPQRRPAAGRPSR